MEVVFISTAQIQTSHGAKAVSPALRRDDGVEAHMYQVYSNKILTSARNGELIMWDLNKTGPSKYGE